MWTVPRVPALHSSLIMASFSILLGGAAIAFSAYSVRRPFLMARRWVSLDIRRVAGNSFMARGKPLKVGEELNVNLYAWQRPLPPRPHTQCCKLCLVLLLPAAAGITLPDSLRGKIQFLLIFRLLACLIDYLID